MYGSFLALFAGCTDVPLAVAAELPANVHCDGPMLTLDPMEVSLTAYVRLPGTDPDDPGLADPESDTEYVTIVNNCDVDLTLRLDLVDRGGDMYRSGWFTLEYYEDIDGGAAGSRETVNALLTTIPAHGTMLRGVTYTTFLAEDQRDSEVIATDTSWLSVTVVPNSEQSDTSLFRAESVLDATVYNAFVYWRDEKPEE